MGYATGTMARYSYVASCSSALNLLGSGARGVRCTKFRTSLVPEEERMAVSKEETGEIECCSPSSSVSYVPMTAPGMGPTLEVSALPPDTRVVLSIPFRRDRLSEQDCGRHDA